MITLQKGVKNYIISNIYQNYVSKIAKIWLNMYIEATNTLHKPQKCLIILGWWRNQITEEFLVKFLPHFSDFRGT